MNVNITPVDIGYVWCYSGENRWVEKFLGMKVTKCHNIKIKIINTCSLLYLWSICLQSGTSVSFLLFFKISSRIILEYTNNVYCFTCIHVSLNSNLNIRTRNHFNIQQCFPVWKFNNCNCCWCSYNKKNICPQNPSGSHKVWKRKDERKYEKSRWDTGRGQSVDYFYYWL